jgi:hypothetical protein
LQLFRSHCKEKIAELYYSEFSRSSTNGGQIVAAKRKGKSKSNNKASKRKKKLSHAEATATLAHLLAMASAQGRLSPALESEAFKTLSQLHTKVEAALDPPLGCCTYSVGGTIYHENKTQAACLLLNGQWSSLPCPQPQ